MNKYWNNKIEIPKYIESKLERDVKNNKEKELVEELCFDKNEMVKLYKIDGNSFSKIFETNRKYLFRGNLTAPSSENDYTTCCNYVTENGLSGFSITQDGWLISFFSNQKWKGFSKHIKKYMNSVKKLVFIATTESSNQKLAEIYQKLGFQICVLTTNDEMEMIKCYGDKFVSELLKFYGGKPYHIFMIKTQNKVETIKQFDNYYVAYDYVNSLKI